jgi:phosphomannomutase
MKVSDIIRQGNIAFGTSGARGLVTDFTPKICAAFATAFFKLKGQLQACGHWC